jgi:hypothetical protein
MSTHRDVARRWAERSGPQGCAKRDLRGFNMFMDGDTLFSYGRHFRLGHWVTLPNCAHYSVSTSKHQTITRNALWRWGGNCKTFTVPFGYLTPANLDYYDAQIKEAEDKAKRARIYGPMHRERADELRQERHAYNMLLSPEEQRNEPVCEPSL